MHRERVLSSIDGWTLGIMSLLVVFGIVMIGSANGWVYDRDHFSLDPLMVRQLIGFGIGLAAIVIIQYLPIRFLKKAAFPAYILVLILLVLVLRFGEGASEGDTVKRWLRLGSEISLQPSELSKIALILLLAQYFDRFQAVKNRFFPLLLAVVLSAIPILLVFREPDLSTTLVLVAVVLTCFFAGKVHLAYILVAILILAGGVILVVTDALSSTPRLLNPYQTERILAWLHPDDYALTTAYQSIQSRNAIGSGGLFGKGLFQNSGMVPIATTDFIFGIIGEETGLIGASVVMSLYYLLSARILRLSLTGTDQFAKVLSCGFAAMIAVQATIHMGVSIAVLPNTGLPLPFISYGLSSLTANMVGVGLVLRVLRERTVQ